jgi:hypothetical protein
MGDYRVFQNKLQTVQSTKGKKATLQAWFWNTATNTDANDYFYTYYFRQVRKFWFQLQECGKSSY